MPTEANRPELPLNQWFLNRRNRPQAAFRDLPEAAIQPHRASSGFAAPKLPLANSPDRPQAAPRNAIQIAADWQKRYAFRL